MEILVATVIFAFVSVALLTLFDYTLKINRRSEALRQASQGMRNFMEFVVKEIRNGQVDYGIENGLVLRPSIPACPIPSTVNGFTYQSEETRLGIVDYDGKRSCLYLGNGSGISDSAGNYLWLNKESFASPQLINPPNFSVARLAFFIRPLRDPYVDVPGIGYAQQQPYVTISALFRIILPSGETVPVYYQTTVSTQKYDLPK